jgi:hypothetical protein
MREVTAIKRGGLSWFLDPESVDRVHTNQRQPKKM